jgi:polyphosphate kinase
VKIELCVRGICCLKPGVEGYTDNIRIVSIVGRYLEHSRIYVFGTKARRRVFISSADFMTRNTVHRVEVAAPILDKKLREQAVGIVQLCLSDNVKARIGQPDGTFRHCEPVTGRSAVNAQETQYRRAAKAAEKE